MTIENNGSLGEALAEQFQGMNVDSPQVMDGELQAPGAPRGVGRAQSRIGDANDRTACKVLFFGGGGMNDNNNHQADNVAGAAAFNQS
jgi:hypothetical protein